MKTETVVTYSSEEKLQTRNCRLFYKLGLSPTEEVLDPTPLAIPLGMETPLTRREMFEMFGYGSYSNTALYDEDDMEFDNEEFPNFSPYEVDDETGNTYEEAKTSKEAEDKALADKLLREHLLSSAGEKLPAEENTTEAQGAEGDSGAE